MRQGRHAEFAGNAGDAINAFWRWFVERTPALLKLTGGDAGLVDALDEHLKAIHPGVGFEMGAPSPRPRDFTITAAGNAEVFPVVQQIVAAAPAMPEQWRIFAFRQRGKTEDVTLEMGDLRLGDQDIWFSLEPMDQGVGMRLYVRDLPPDNESGLGMVQEAVYILLDNAIGEYDVVTAIDGIDWHPLPRGPALLGLRPLSELPAAIDEAKAARGGGR